MSGYLRTGGPYLDGRVDATRRNDAGTGVRLYAVNYRIVAEQRPHDLHAPLVPNEDDPLVRAGADVTVIVACNTHR
jgi:hypothetical protein